MENKTPEEIIQSIRVNKANLDHIASTNKINGSLFVDFKRCLEEYGKQQYNQGVFDAAENAEISWGDEIVKNAYRDELWVDEESILKLLKQ